MEKKVLSPLRTFEYHVGEALKRVERVKTCVDDYCMDDNPALPWRKTLLLRDNLDYVLNVLKEIACELEYWRLRDEKEGRQGFWDVQKHEEVFFDKEETDNL